MSEIRRPDAYDQDVDPDVWSGTSINGVRLTWKELAERNQEEIYRLQKFATIVSDLDRCEHGRHAGDVCSGCNGPSRGNPHMAPGQVIGYSLGGGYVIIQPPREKRGDPEAWYRPKPKGEE